MWNKYIMRLVRLIIGVFKPTWMPQAPKGETVPKHPRALRLVS